MRPPPAAVAQLDLARGERHDLDPLGQQLAPVEGDYRLEVRWLGSERADGLRDELLLVVDRSMGLCARS